VLIVLGKQTIDIYLVKTIILFELQQ